MEAKDRVLAGFEKLREIVSEIIDKNKEHSRCWWNGCDCPFYSDMKGFENAGKWCDCCSWMDRARFFDVLENIFGSYLEKERKEAREEGEWNGKKEAEERAEEASEKAYDEIAQGIDNLVEELVSIKG